MENLDNVEFYNMSIALWDFCWNDCEVLMHDIRSREVCKQLIRAVGSISANIDEGYGRGFGKEYPHFLRVARGSAREARGWYIKSKFLMDDKVIKDRHKTLSSIIAMLTKSIETLENKKRK